MHGCPCQKLFVTVLFGEFVKYGSVCGQCREEAGKVADKTKEASHLLCGLWWGPVLDAVCFAFVGLNPICRDMVPKKIKLFAVQL